MSNTPLIEPSETGPHVVAINGLVYGYCARCCELPAEFGSEGDFLVTVAKKFSRQHARCRPWPKGIPVKQYLKSLQNPAAKQEA